MSHKLKNSIGGKKAKICNKEQRCFAASVGRIKYEHHYEIKLIYSYHI